MSITRGQARTQRKVERLSDVSDRYGELIASGSTRPAADLAKELGVAPGTVRTWIHRARSEGFLPSTSQGVRKASDHEPRRVDWGPGSWLACVSCHVEWPCATSQSAGPSRPRRVCDLEGKYP